MKRLESNQTEQSWFCCSIHFTGVNCRRQDFRTVPFIYLLRIYDSIHVDQVYRKHYIRNIVKILLSRGRHVHLKTYKQKKTAWMKMLREIFLGIFSRSLSCKGSEYQRLFLFQLNQVLLETDYSSEASNENLNILLLPAFTHRFFPAEALKTTAHGLPKISRNLSSNGPTFGKKYKTGFLFSNIGIKQSKMGTETTKIALNAHVHLRTANQQMSRPERQVDNITDMPRSCRLRENTSGRRPLGSSSWLLKVLVNWSADSFRLNHVASMS